VLAAGFVLPLAAARAQNMPDLSSATEFRVCADPHDLPFSNEKGEGYENRIAELLGKSLHLPVSYTWFPDSQGFVRATLMRHRCDVVIGTPAGVEDMDTTNPYLHTGYMLVTREADHVTATRVDDPHLLGKRFGAVAQTPPTDLLARANLSDSTHFYPLVVDTRVQQPARQMLQDLADGRIDVALVWGPVAGYAIKHDHLPLHAVFIDGNGGPVRMDYRIAMGVRPGDVAFRRTLNQAVLKEMPAITAILQDYGIPMMDEQGREVPAAATR
jgi:quinoprotein dehydrogenase-associated probable ABC transporter substrate-binding protein